MKINVRRKYLEKSLGQTQNQETEMKKNPNLKKSYPFFEVLPKNWREKLFYRAFTQEFMLDAKCINLVINSIIGSPEIHMFHALYLETICIMCEAYIYIDLVINLIDSPEIYTFHALHLQPYKTFVIYVRIAYNIIYTKY